MPNQVIIRVIGAWSRVGAMDRGITSLSHGVSDGVHYGLKVVGAGAWGKVTTQTALRGGTVKLVLWRFQACKGIIRVVIPRSRCSPYPGSLTEWIYLPEECPKIYK